MKDILMVGLGGGVGSICRYWVSSFIQLYVGKTFPFGTISVNCIGSFFIGLLVFLITARFQHFEHQLKNFLIIGFLGGFTTFSSFSFETLVLLKNDQYFLALLNILSNIFLCFLLTFLGIRIAKFF